MQRVIILLFLIGSAFSSFSQKYSNEFLSIGAGARGQGMGNAQVSLVDDVTSGYWNPAGLLGIKEDLQVSFMHSEWFAGISKYDYFSIAAPLKSKSENPLNRAIGFSFIRFGTDDIPNTLFLFEDDGTINYDNIREFSAADYAFVFSYAQRVFNKLDAGANFKIVHRTVGPFANSWGFGLDIGAKYKIKQNFAIGLNLKDITTTFNAWNFQFTDEEKQVLALANQDIPENSVEITKPQIILGGSYQKDFNLGAKKRASTEETTVYRTFGLAGALDLQMTTDGRRNTLISGPISINPAIGLELDYDKLIYLRGGINNFQKSSDILGKEFWAMQPSAGLGIQLWKVRMDYTFTNLGDQQEKLYSHMVSLLIGIDFGFFKEQIKRAG